MQIAGGVFLITGGASGLGAATARMVVAGGGRVVLADLDEAKGQALAAELAGNAYFVRTDVTDEASAKAAVAAADERFGRLDVLVNNAGAVHRARELTEDGIERTFAVNHLGYFLLTNLLLDRLRESAPARVVSVASLGHRQGTLDFDDLGFERGYQILKAYARSKLANVLFCAELSRRLAGTGVTSNCLHPGAVATNIWSGAPFWAKPLIWLLMPL